jgi:hypothetical protein
MHGLPGAAGDYRREPLLFRAISARIFPSLIGIITFYVEKWPKITVE